MQSKQRQVEATASAMTRLRFHRHERLPSVRCLGRRRIDLRRMDSRVPCAILFDGRHREVRDHSGRVNHDVSPGPAGRDGEV
jgi:hypothetical protein